MTRLCFRALAITSSAVLMIAGLTACERRPEGAEPVDTAPVASPDPDPELYPPEISPGFALAVAKRASRTYVTRGWTDRATEVRIEVEDGHNILFGPAVLPVRDEQFQAEFTIEPSDRDHVFIYVTDGTGVRLAVVPVDTARALTTVGPEGRIRPDATSLPE